MLFDALWCQVQKARADALRLFIRMSDPDDGLEGRIRVVDLVHERILHHGRQCGVKPGRRFLKIPSRSNINDKGRIVMIKRAPSSIKTSARLNPYAIASDNLWDSPTLSKLQGLSQSSFAIPHRSAKTMELSKWS